MNLYSDARDGWVCDALRYDSMVSERRERGAIPHGNLAKGGSRRSSAGDQGDPAGSGPDSRRTPRPLEDQSPL
jgi:hypothetical protein